MLTDLPNCNLTETIAILCKSDQLHPPIEFKVNTETSDRLTINTNLE